MTTAAVILSLLALYLLNDWRMRRVIAQGIAAGRKIQQCRRCTRKPQGCLGRFNDRCMGDDK